MDSDHLFSSSGFIAEEDSQESFIDEEYYPDYSQPLAPSGYNTFEDFEREQIYVEQEVELIYNLIFDYCVKNDCCYLIENCSFSIFRQFCKHLSSTEIYNFLS